MTGYRNTIQRVPSQLPSAVICRSDRTGTIQGFNSQLGMVLSALRRGNRIAPQGYWRRCRSHRWLEEIV